MLWPILSQGKSVNYFEYHGAVNLAEKMIFVQNEIISGLEMYEDIFSRFDYLYAGDCVIASQIAVFNRDSRRLGFFLQRAFENGLSWRTMKGIPYIFKSALFQKDSVQLKSLYAMARKKYLSRIDTVVLKKMYYIFVDDQLNKNNLKGTQEPFTAFQKRYGPVSQNLFKQINEIIRSHGVPMDRIIGLQQQDLMKELKLDCPDLLEFYFRNKNSCPTILVKEQFVLDEWSLASNFYLTIVIHQQNILNQFDSSMLRNQIRMGNIHPKDVAFLHYNFYRGRVTPVGFKRPQFLIGYNPDRLRPNCGPVPDSVIDLYRAGLSIPPIEQDRRKWKFMLEHGMNFIWGYCGIRA